VRLSAESLIRVGEWAMLVSTQSGNDHGGCAVSHHNEKEKKTKPADEMQPDDAARRVQPEPGEDDVEGHNLLAMSDYYVQSKMGRNADIEREARQRALAKEAKSTKPEQRR
jgi:hypothetical protein